MTPKKIESNSNTFIFEALLALTVVILPFLIYLHLFFNELNSTITMFGYEYKHGIESNSVMVWMVLIRMIPIALFTIWYFECEYYWRGFVLLQVIPWLDDFLRRTILFPSTFIEENIAIFSIIINIIFLTSIILIRRSVLYKFETSSLSISQLFKKSVKLEAINDRIVMLTQKTDKGMILKQLVLLEKTIQEDLKTNHQKTITKRTEFAIIFILVVNLLIFYLHYLFQETARYEIFGYSISSHGFNDFSTFVWFICIKLGLLFPCIVWFFTSSNWWRYAVLSPIILTVYQLWEVLQSTGYEVDEVSLIYSLPAITIIAILLIFISKKIRYSNRIKEIRVDIEFKINTVLDTWQNYN